MEAIRVRRGGWHASPVSSRRELSKASKGHFIRGSARVETASISHPHVRLRCGEGGETPLIEEQLAAPRPIFCGDRATGQGRLIAGTSAHRHSLLYSMKTRTSRPAHLIPAQEPDLDGFPLQDFLRELR